MQGGENVEGQDFYGDYIQQASTLLDPFLAGVHELKEQHPHDAELLKWACALKALFEQAVAWAAQGPDPSLSPQPFCRAQGAPLNDCSQDQWQHSQSQRLGHAHGPCQPFWHLDHALSQSVPALLDRSYPSIISSGVKSEHFLRTLFLDRQIIIV
jgi:hypothetical protein